MKSSQQQPACTRERLRSRRAGGKTGRWWRVLIDHEMHTQQRREDTGALRASGTKASSGEAKSVSSEGERAEWCQDSAAAVVFHAFSVPSPISPVTISHQPSSPIAAGQWFTGAARRLGFRRPRGVEDGYGLRMTNRYGRRGTVGYERGTCIAAGLRYLSP
jgi:hypothetical protein